MVLEFDLREPVKNCHKRVFPKMRLEQKERIKFFIRHFSHVLHRDSVAPPFEVHRRCGIRRYFIVGRLTKKYLEELAQRLFTARDRPERFLVSDLITFPSKDDPPMDFLR